MSGLLAPASASSSTLSASVPNPQSLVPDQSDFVDKAVQRRLSRKPSLLSRLRGSPLSKSKRQSTHGTPEASSHEPIATSKDDPETGSIHLNSAISLAIAEAAAPEGDIYEWAVVYENQRGVTIFSTPYYSNLSLLPTDPSPFTLPNASKRRSEQPPINLENYPLPDGNWQWVSRCWMIDMRSDSGEVQHDGWEYNNFFRKHGWKGSTGGWVRRRRWIRLMVRMGKHKNHDGKLSPHTSSGTPSRRSTPKPGNRQSIGSSIPLSLISGASSLPSRWDDMDPNDVWLGDGLEEDWDRCHRFLKKCSRDGRKLELWRLWLGYYHPDHMDQFTVEDSSGQRREKQWTEDEGPLPSEMAALEMFTQQSVTVAPREYVIPVLRNYGQHILKSFIYPDSRAEFIKLLALSSLLQESNIPSGGPLQTTDLDFYSYSQSFSTVTNPSAGGTSASDER